MVTDLARYVKALYRNCDLGPSTFTEPAHSLPSAVVLMPVDEYPYGYIGASLIHFPINASFLYTDRQQLSPIALAEIKRLAPTGEKVSAQILLIGPLGSQIEETLRANGFTTLRIAGANFYETAAEAAYFRLIEIPPMTTQGKHIMIASTHSPAAALPAVYYAAHQGFPIVIVGRDAIPEATSWVMGQFPDYTYTLFATPEAVNPIVINQIRSRVRLDIIQGLDPYEISANFAQRPHSQFQLGWDRNRPGMGDAFSFGTCESWAKTVAGCLFSHVGKHTPLLLVYPAQVPQVVKDYLLYLNPELSEPPRPPFMHGYILGAHQDISYEVQVELEEHLILRAEGH